jgi:hypothetical protein
MRPVRVLPPPGVSEQEEVDKNPAVYLFIEK